MTSPSAASTAVLPESRDDTLYTAATLRACSAAGDAVWALLLVWWEGDVLHFD